MCADTTDEDRPGPTPTDRVGATNRTERVNYEIERRVLCNRIAELEAKLEQERRHRERIVDRYERLLAEQRDEESEERALLDGLF